MKDRGIMLCYIGCCYPFSGVRGKEDLLIAFVADAAVDVLLLISIPHWSCAFFFLLLHFLRGSDLDLNMNVFAPGVAVYR